VSHGEKYALNGQQQSHGVRWTSQLEVWGDDELFAVDIVDACDGQCDPPCVSIDINDQGFIELNLIRRGGCCTHIFTLTPEGEWQEKRKDQD